MKDLKEIIRLLENFNLKVIAEAADAEEMKEEIIDYLKSIPLDAKVMPNEVLAGLRGREYNIVRSALNRQQKYLEAFVKEYKTETNTPVTYGTVKEEIEIIKALLK